MMDKVTEWRIVRLLKELKNPGKVDRRDKSDWRRFASWPAGARFVIATGTALRPHWDRETRETVVEGYQAVAIYSYESRHPRLYDVVISEEHTKTPSPDSQTDLIGAAILDAAFEELPQTYAGWKIVHGKDYSGHASEIVQRLLSEGHLTFAALERMTREIDDEVTP